MFIIIIKKNVRVCGMKPKHIIKKTNSSKQTLKDYCEITEKSWIKIYSLCSQMHVMCYPLLLGPSSFYYLFVRPYQTSYHLSFQIHYFCSYASAPRSSSNFYKLWRSPQMPFLHFFANTHTTLNSTSVATRSSAPFPKLFVVGYPLS